MLLFVKLNLLLVCRINCSLDSLRQSDSYPYYSDCSQWFLVLTLHTVWFEFINNWSDDSCMKLSLVSKWKDFSKWCGVLLPYFVEYLCLLFCLISLVLFSGKQHKSVHVIAVIYTYINMDPMLNICSSKNTGISLLYLWYDCVWDVCVVL